MKFKLEEKDEKSFQAKFKVFENTWSKQRRKRRKKLNLKINMTSLEESNDDSNESTCSKKIADDNDNDNDDKKDVLVALLTFEIGVKFKSCSKDQIIMLEMNSDDIFLSNVRENLNQILQFIKNKICK